MPSVGRVIHYWATILWLTVGVVVWIILRDALWFVGFMSLYAIWVTHLAGWAAETPVEAEAEAVAGVPREAQSGRRHWWRPSRRSLEHSAAIDDETRP